MRYSLLLFLLAPLLTVAQEDSRNLILIGIGHSRIDVGIKGGEARPIVLPVWAIDYNYELSENWFLGLHNEIIIESFEYEPNTQSTAVERSTPFASVAILGYSHHFLSVYTGGGIEYSPEESFGLIRFGLEAGFETLKDFETIVGLNYDWRPDAYTSIGWTIGLGYKF